MASVQLNPHQVLQEDVRRIGSNPVRFLRWIERHFRPLARQYFLDMQQACRDSEAVIFATLAFAAYHVAEARGIPTLAAYLQPATPTRAFPNPTGFDIPQWLPFSGVFNWLSFRLANLAFIAMVRGTINHLRGELLGLPPVPWRVYARLDVAEIPILYGFSRHVIPKPADWGEWLHTTGYWFLDSPASWQPPADLLAFLDDGPPPVYIGFGSMVDMEAEMATRLAIEALQLCRRRAVLLGGWSNLGANGLPETILRLDNVPHEWLFPRMAAVVHHGGAGTTAAGLRAGVPAVIVPFFADQPFWGRRLQQLGVAPPPIPRQKMTARRLAKAIEIASSDVAMARQAARLGAKIRAEDGVSVAVQLAERYLATGLK
jgi:UDP:flavonoid glycosyltransferase YjiC (YdhE family)